MFSLSVCGFTFCTMEVSKASIWFVWDNKAEDATASLTQEWSKDSLFVLLSEQYITGFPFTCLVPFLLRVAFLTLFSNVLRCILSLAQKEKLLNLGPKMPHLGIFGLELENNIAIFKTSTLQELFSYLKSTPSNLGNCKISRKKNV